MEASPATDPPRANYHQYGLTSRLWEHTVFIGLWMTLPGVWWSVFRDLLTGDPVEAGSALAWLGYGVVQIASKTPISFRYHLRGWQAALDLSAFAVSVAAVFALALSLGQLAPVWAWRCSSGLALAALVYSLLFARFADTAEGPVSLRNELFAKSVGTAVNCPMFLALITLSTP